MLAYTLMGASNFLGLNWGLFKDYPTDLDQVVESFMHIIDGGIFTERVSEFRQSQGRCPSASRWSLTMRI